MVRQIKVFMKLDDYQKKSRVTALYGPIGGRRFLYPVLGLAGEAGELLNKIKKIFRDQRGQVSKETKEAIASELGDILWYLSQVSTEFGFKLSSLAERNLQKLQSRARRGKLGGAGDKR
jgi:NTP pyrophosphatase (non-canonical NTP hydrolase)